MKNYIVLDIENPNSRGNTICSIALLKVVSGEVVDKIYTLINPEDRFDARNSEITNINNSMVLDKPTLKELWPKISRLIGNDVIVGHNVVYDLSVLSKSLDRYGIEVPVFRYSCTLQLSKRYLDSYSYKLEELAKQIGVEYTAHIAEEDAYATYRLFEYINNNNDIDDSCIKDYSFEKSGVSSKLDYLFVGGIGSEAWKFGNVGGKIVKALELQEKGCSIKIISEEDMFVGLID